MHIRRLRIEDAPLMFEWMSDKSITEYLNRDFFNLTIIDAENFIKNSIVTSDNLHFAIASDEDEYMGTVSLKNVKDGFAEFGISIRKKAMHCGYAWYAMEHIIAKGFNELGLDGIYWCVSSKNKRAVRFYEKHNFHETIDMPDEILNNYKGIEDLKWYSVLKGDGINIRDSVAGCKIIHIKTISTLNAGELSFFESLHEISFEIKRIYYISKVPEGTRRGFHAHKKLKQILFCPYGRIQLTLENKNGREEVELSDPSIGVVIEEPTWREMLWLQKDSVLCVAASDYYNVEDYIRNYDEFNHYIK